MQTYPVINAVDLISASRVPICDRDDAVGSWFLGAVEPVVMFAGMPFIDTTASLIKVRNATNLAWITIGTLATNLGHLPLAGGVMTGKITLDGNPASALHAVPRQYADTFLLKAGGTMTGDINMATHKITNLPAPADDAEPATKSYVAGLGYPVNKGKAWISHGDNVITFAVAHGDTLYKIIATPVNTAMGDITTRGNAHTQPLSVLVKNDTVSRGLVRINGGYGFSSCGFEAAVSGRTERYEDVANTHTARGNATARDRLAGFSLNGLGFSTCGETNGGNLITNTTERFDDIINTHTARTGPTARYRLAGYSLNGYGITSCGNNAINVIGTTERFDDVANAWTARLDATIKQFVAGFSLNGYGFTSGGDNGIGNIGTTERFDDTANTHTARTNTTSRNALTGYSLGGLGFTSCGFIAAVSAVTEALDDVANSQTARTSATTARRRLAGYGLNGFGFSTCGDTGAVSGVTERFDNLANTHTARLGATARECPAGFATNEYFINYVTYA